MVMIKLPRVPKIKILIGLVIIIIISPFFFKAYKSLWLRKEKLMAQINKNIGELNKASALYSAQDTLNAEMKRLNSKLSSAEDKFSSGTEEIFVDINRFALECKVSLKAIEPLERTRIEISGRKNPYLELLPLNLRVKCDFRQLMLFLYKIEQSENLMLIGDIKIQSDPRDIWNHDIQISLKVPILLS